MRRSRPPNLPPAAVARWPWLVRHWHAAVAIASPAHSSSETRDTNVKERWRGKPVSLLLPAPRLLGPRLSVGVGARGDAGGPGIQAARPISWPLPLSPGCPGALSHGLAPLPLHQVPKHDPRFLNLQAGRAGTQTGLRHARRNKELLGDQSDLCQPPTLQLQHVALVALCSCILSCDFAEGNVCAAGKGLFAMNLKSLHCTACPRVSGQASRAEEEGKKI